jgi:hypothetical protein
MHLLRPAALLLLVVCSTASATPSVKRTQTAAVLPAHVRLARGRALSSFKLGPRRADHAEDEHDHEEEGHEEEGHEGHDHEEEGHDEEGHDEEEDGHDHDMEVSPRSTLPCTEMLYSMLGGFA